MDMVVIYLCLYDSKPHTEGEQLICIPSNGQANERVARRALSLSLRSDITSKQSSPVATAMPSNVNKVIEVPTPKLLRTLPCLDRLEQ